MVSKCNIINVSRLARISENGSTEVTRFMRICEGEVANGSRWRGMASEASRFAMFAECKMIEVIKVSKLGSPEVTRS